MEEVKKHEDAIARLTICKADALARISAAQAPKRLICGSGDELHDATTNAFASLGFQVVKMPGRRTDILARDENRLLAIEVKGFDNRGARAEDMGQASRWLSDVTTALVASDETLSEDPHLAELSEAFKMIGVTRSDPPKFSCKAVLVAEAYRLTPLADRNSPSFSADLNLELKRREICALSGTQLLCLVEKAKKESETKKFVSSFFPLMDRWLLRIGPSFFLNRANRLPRQSRYPDIHIAHGPNSLLATHGRFPRHARTLVAESGDRRTLQP